jgi:hypothetical protein
VTDPGEAEVCKVPGQAAHVTGTQTCSYWRVAPYKGNARASLLGVHGECPTGQIDLRRS